MEMEGAVGDETKLMKGGNCLLEGEKVGRD